MERFEDAVTDPEFRLADVKAFLRRMESDARFRDRFRVA